MRRLAFVVWLAVLAAVGAVGVAPAAATQLAPASLLAPSTQLAPASLGAISGSVAFAGGGMIAEASINIRPIKGGASTGTVLTTSGGYFMVDDVEPGTYWVVVNANGATPLTIVHEQVFGDADGPIAVEVLPGVETTGVHIVVAEAGSVSGTVSYDSSASAVSAERPAMITAVRFDELTGFATPYGSTRMHGIDGTFTMWGLLPGEYTLLFGDSPRGRITTEFYGDSPWVTNATTFTVTAGVEVTGINAVIGAGPHDPHNVFRFDGQDRFEAAVALSENSIDAGDDVPVVYIVNGLGYADALSAGPAAAYEGGVLLTVRPTGIPAVVQAELERLNPDRIEIVGGPASVSETVRAQLQLIAPTTRITGADRYDVSRAVANKVWGADGSGEAFMVTGHNFPDALSAGSIAAIRGAPVILVNSYIYLGAMTPLDIPTRQLLVDLGVGEVHIVGGPASVTSRIEDDLIAMPQLYLVDRFGGEDRFEASSNLAQAFPQSDVRFLATGYNYPDALAGSWLAGRAGGAVILVPGTCVSQAAAFLIENVEYIGILGGTASVTPAAAAGTVC